MTAQIHIGTSGYSYDDWVGPIYPEDVKKTDWLKYYAERLFHCTEINYTYYRLPAARTLKAMADKTPPRSSRERINDRHANAHCDQPAGDSRKIGF